MPVPRRLGSDAEDAAASYLLDLGYTLITRRAKTARGELDIVCLDGECLVFVEVKSRSGNWETPEEGGTGPCEEGGVRGGEMMTLTPARDGTDGFFAAVLERRA